MLLQRNEIIAVVAHAIALASIPVSLFGFLGLSRRLGLDRPLVSAALVTYSFGAVAAMCAAVASGLIAPMITRRMLTLMNPCGNLCDHFCDMTSN